MTWAALGAPLDSAGEGKGEERAPEALRATGLIERVSARDLGDVVPVLRPPQRDPRTGIVAFAGVVESSEALARVVAGVLSRDERPLVLGGDCTLLIGVAAGLRRVGLEPGLLFVDGHADYYDGGSSPTGEAADMDLAIVHGDGPEELTALAGAAPLIAPERTVILGHRPPDLDPDVAFERARVPGSVKQIDATAIGDMGAEQAARRSLEHLDGGNGAWLHLDLDALDETELSAVSYPQPRGLSWEQLEELISTLLASSGSIGISVADFNPDLDPDGEQALKIGELLVRILGDSLE